jgi:hypothetical protein
VVVVLLLVEPETPDELPVPIEPLPLVLPLVPPLEPDEPVPVAPIELVPPLLPVVVSELPLALPVVELGLVLLEPRPALPELDGEVVLLELVEPDPAAPVLSRLLHALRERAATTARTAAVAWVRDVFIRKLLGWFVRSANRKGSRDCPVVTLGRRGRGLVGTSRIRV